MSSYWFVGHISVSMRRPPQGLYQTFMHSYNLFCPLRIHSLSQYDNMYHFAESSDDSEMYTNINSQYKGRNRLNSLEPSRLLSQQTKSLSRTLHRYAHMCCMFHWEGTILLTMLYVSTITRKLVVMIQHFIMTWTLHL